MVRVSLMKFLLLCQLMLVGVCAASAQTWIINIPSPDVVAEKKTYVEFDFYGHLQSYQNGGSQTYFARALYGATKNVEVGLNVMWSKAAAPDQPVEAQPTIKWQYYKNEKHGIVMSGGFNGFFTVANRTGSDNFGQYYSSFSKKFSGSHGPRVTAGGYGLVARASGTGSKGGAMLGFEQPLNSKVSWVNDWFSGKNRFGYASSGFAIVPNAKTSLGVAYSFGNQGRGNNGLLAWAGYTF